MVFSSHLFLFYFLPVVLAVYYLLPRRGRNLFLMLASYFFYGWTNPSFILILLFSTTVDYGVGLLLSKKEKSKLALALSLICNLGLLGFFKYFNFGVDSWNALINLVGLEGLRLGVMLRVVLPLGISFYTFQSMSYTIDVYRGNARPIKNFIDFACFVSMFPQLVAGPIIRFTDVADQLRNREETITKFARGTLFFSVGLAKKVLLANSCGKVADTIFGGSVPACLDAWYGLVSYAFQIYFDFSAYSDMAIGLGLMLGFIFPKNFDSPYRSKSITEFWRRWHISLSSWLRDYLYIPLGGNRKGVYRTYVNLMLVMLLGGLWHGAAWNFVIWGGLHGVALATERWLGERNPLRKFPSFVQEMLTFIFILLTWVFFRAGTLQNAIIYCKGLLGIGSEDRSLLLRELVYNPYYLTVFLLCAVVVWFAPQTWDWSRKITIPKVIVTFLLLVLSIVVLSMQSYNPFIYFIF